jgi:hypothetical protein
VVGPGEASKAKAREAWAAPNQRRHQLAGVHASEPYAACLKKMFLRVRTCLECVISRSQVY